MKKITRTITVLTTIIIVTSVMAFAGTTDFSTRLPIFNNPTTVIDFEYKTTNISGSSVKLNTAVTGNDKVAVWTEIIFANSGQSSMFSPKIDLSTRDGKNNGLGSYNELTGKTGDRVRLRMPSYTWNGDDIAGTWDYK